MAFGERFVSGQPSSLGSIPAGLGPRHGIGGVELIDDGHCRYRLVHGEQCSRCIEAQSGAGCETPRLDGEGEQLGLRRRIGRHRRLFGAPGGSEHIAGGEKVARCVHLIADRGESTVNRPPSVVVHQRDRPRQRGGRGRRRGHRGGRPRARAPRRHRRRRRHRAATPEAVVHRARRWRAARGSRPARRPPETRTASAKVSETTSPDTSCSMRSGLPAARSTSLDLDGPSSVGWSLAARAWAARRFERWHVHDHDARTALDRQRGAGRDHQRHPIGQQRKHLERRLVTPVGILDHQRSTSETSRDVARYVDRHPAERRGRKHGPGGDTADRRAARATGRRHAVGGPAHGGRLSTCRFRPGPARPQSFQPRAAFSRA